MADKAALHTAHVAAMHAKPHTAPAKPSTRNYTVIAIITIIAIIAIIWYEHKHKKPKPPPGKCPPSCDGYICDSTTSLCLTSCTGTSQCTGSATCVANQCVTPQVCPSICGLYLCDSNQNCYTGCTGNGQCVASAICGADGTCVTPPVCPDTCGLFSCDASGQCFTGCSGANDCVPSATCGANGQCGCGLYAAASGGTACGATCASAADCAVGGACAGGVCSCGNYVFNPATSECFTGCTGSDQCAGATPWCKSGACVPAPDCGRFYYDDTGTCYTSCSGATGCNTAAGAVCQSDGTCSCGLYLPLGSGCAVGCAGSGAGSGAASCTNGAVCDNFSNKCVCPNSSILVDGACLSNPCGSGPYDYSCVTSPDITQTQLCVGTDGKLYGPGATCQQNTCYFNAISGHPITCGSGQTCNKITQIGAGGTTTGLPSWGCSKICSSQMDCNGQQFCIYEPGQVLNMGSGAQDNSKGTCQTIPGISYPGYGYTLLPGYSGFNGNRLHTYNSSCSSDRTTNLARQTHEYDDSDVRMGTMVRTCNYGNTLYFYLFNNDYPMSIDPGQITATYNGG